MDIEPKVDQNVKRGQTKDKRYSRFQYYFEEVLKDYIQETKHDPSTTSLRQFISWAYTKRVELLLGIKKKE